MRFKIAVVQMEMQTWQPEKNLAKMEGFIKKAKHSGAELILFPEDCVTGPIMKNPQFVDRKFQYVRFFQNLAKKYGIDMVPGTWMEEDQKLKGWYNTCYYIDKEGKILGQYRKIHLWLSERSFLTPGKQITVFHTRFGKIGLMICWDLIFPEICRTMARQNTKIILCPSHWTKALATQEKRKDLPENWEAEHVNHLIAARAIENEMAIVYANLAGKCTYYEKHKDEMIGQSQITMPFFTPLKSLKHNEEEMLISEIDTEYLNLAERFYKIRADLKKSLQ